MNRPSNLSVYRLLAFLAVILCLLSIVEAALPQFQMSLLGGRLLIGNGPVKAVLLVTVLLGYLLRPEIAQPDIPMSAWLVCIGFLVFEAAYLYFARGVSPGGVVQSYSGYYVLLLIGPALPAFRDAISERTILRCTIFLFLVCATIGIAQNLTAQPILYTESADGAFKVYSWSFFDEVRAFSLFTSAMNFGMFCALCGALGVALCRTLPQKGALLFIVSALACYCTLTRLCYLVFICACTCAAVLTFGRKPARALWHPVLYFGLAIMVILAGVSSPASTDSSGLQDSSSLLERLVEWGYYSNIFVHSTMVHQLFGLGMVQNDNVLPELPMAIDNSFLALILHIGLIGLLLFGVLLVKMWLYLRREALATQQPFIIAAAGLWATLALAGTFNIVFSVYGAVFTLVILCTKDATRIRQTHREPLPVECEQG